jgi:uncharacterized protein CbrC (UPF0167 family)
VELPTFRYHPDPIGTESVELSDAECVRCEQARGAIYVGPVYAEDELDESICPWCIADGSAHEEFDAEFTDAAGVGTGAGWDAVVEEVALPDARVHRLAAGALVDALRRRRCVPGPRGRRRHPGSLG